MKPFHLAIASLALFAGPSDLPAQTLPAAPVAPAVMSPPPQVIPRDPLALPGDILPSPPAATLVRTRPNMTLAPGAVPLISAGKVIGAIGVSGATGRQDEICATAGAAAVAGRL